MVLHEKESIPFASDSIGFCVCADPSANSYVLTAQQQQKRSRPDIAAGVIAQAFNVVSDVLYRILEVSDGVIIARSHWNIIACESHIVRRVPVHRQSSPNHWKCVHEGMRPRPISFTSSQSRSVVWALTYPFSMAEIMMACPNSIQFLCFLCNSCFCYFSISFLAIHLTRLRVVGDKMGGNVIRFSWTLLWMGVCVYWPSLAMVRELSDAPRMEYTSASVLSISYTISYTSHFDMIRLLGVCVCAHSCAFSWLSICAPPIGHTVWWLRKAIVTRTKRVRSHCMGETVERNGTDKKLPQNSNERTKISKTSEIYHSLLWNSLARLLHIFFSLRSCKNSV